MHRPKQNGSVLQQAKKNEILRVVNNPNFHPGLTPSEAKAISPSLEVITTETTTSPATSSLQHKPAGNNLAASTYVVTSHYQNDTKQFGIPLGWNRIDYTYVTGSGKVLLDRSCVATYNQAPIPGRTVNVQTDHWVSGGEGTCVAHWSLTRAWGLAGTDRWEQGMTVNGPGIVNKWFNKQ